MSNDCKSSEKYVELESLRVIKGILNRFLQDIQNNVEELRKAGQECAVNMGCSDSNVYTAIEQLNDALTNIDKSLYDLAKGVVIQVENKIYEMETLPEIIDCMKEY